MDNEKKYALLIDADNISHKYIDIILSEAKESGTISIRRIYGDWTDNSKSKWKEILLENSITPIQQYTYTMGKNSSDSAMIIDAMDILYEDKVDGYILASSDSDFTRLAMRLREAGKDIIGMGESKTPPAFVKACRMFKTLDVLYKATLNQRENKPSSKAAGTENVEKTDTTDIAPITSIEVIKKTIVSLVDAKADDDGWLFLGELGNYLLKEYPDFDCRNYGYKKLVELVKECGQLVVRNEKAKGGRIVLVYVKMKEAEPKEQRKADNGSRTRLSSLGS